MAAGQRENHAGLTAIPDGGFSFLPGGLAYSQGVRADAGHAIEHVRFAQCVPVEQGFELIARYLRARSRPLSALCAVELRSPAPLTLDGFREFNRGYAGILEGWGLVRDGMNAVARSNVAPIHHRPAAPSFFAFSFTVPSSAREPSFVVAGSSEWPEGGRFPQDVVRYGDVTADALQEKARFVLEAMRRRIAALGGDWASASVTQAYSVHDHFEFFRQDIASGNGGHGGLVWHYCRPPVVGWEFEMDVRQVRVSRLFDPSEEAA